MRCNILEMVFYKMIIKQFIMILFDLPLTWLEQMLAVKSARFQRFRRISVGIMRHESGAGLNR